MAETRGIRVHGKGKMRFCVLALLLFVSGTSFAAQNAYQSRMSGDRSFTSGDYPVAASFYKRYAEEAAENGDSDSRRDAMERLIDSLILGKMADPAEKQLKEYEVLFPGVNPLSISMWKADILLLKKNPDESVSILKRIMPGLTAEDPRRLRALASLANAYECKKDFLAAADAYQTLREAAAKSPLEKIAFERKVFCLASTNTPALALVELQNLPSPLDEADQETIRLLTIYALIRSEGFDNIHAAWNDALKGSEKVRGPLFYPLFSAIGDRAAAEGLFPMALDALKSAFSHADTKNESYETLEKMIDIFDRMKEPGKAAELAQRSIDLFNASYVSLRSKLKIARIFRSAGKNEEAVKFYRSIMKTPAADSSIRKIALLECVYLLNDIKQYKEAEETLEKGITAPEDQGEVSYLLADLLFRRKEYEKAASAFKQVAEKFPGFREKALYQSALVLFSGKKWQEAEKTADELLQLNLKTPVSAQALYLKGLIQEASGKQLHAEKSFIEYAHHPSAVPELVAKALFKAAKNAFEMNRAEDAEKLLKELADRHPGDPLAPAALCWRIFSIQARGDEIQAERETWQLVDRYGDSAYAVSALFNLAAHYADSGASSRANSVLDNLKKRFPDKLIVMRILLEKARIAFRSGDDDSALRHLEELRLSKPSGAILAEANYLFGDVYRKKGEYKKALVYYRKVLDEKPEQMLEFSVIGSIADLLFTQAKNDSALYQKAHENYMLLLSKKGLPESMRIMALFKCGRCEEMIGNDDKAIEHWKTAVASLSLETAPSVSLWCVKAVEALRDLAKRKPLAAHVEAAVSALQKLADSERMDAETADEWIRQLETLKYKP